MRRLSITLVLLCGCAVHLGTMPVAHPWRLAAVEAPVAEPGIDDAVRAAVLGALSGRDALDAGSADELRVTVTEASWVPTRRGADVLLYEARLSVTFETRDASGAPRVDVRRGVRTVIDPGNAATARTLREQTFAALAREVAEGGVAALVSR